ncbi:MAG: tetratricopeptide repeat protein [Bacteroidales bacterium]|nr:tetratricopeptide repeat protein [Bacteroidales bacterium]
MILDLIFVLNLRFIIFGKLKYLLIIVLYFITMPAIYPDDKDSVRILLNELQHPQNDSSQVDILNKISLNYLNSNMKESLIFARNALNLSNIIDYKSGIAKANCNLGNIFFEQNKYQPAINYFLISVKIFKELGSKNDIAKAYNKLGYIHLIQNDNKQALDAFFKSLIYSTEIGDEYQTAYSFNYIGNTYYNQKRYDLAMDYYKQSLELRKKINDLKGIAGTYNNIGEIFRLKKNYYQALEYYQKSVEINTEIGNRKWLSINYQNIGSIFQDMGDYQKAISFFLKGLEISNNINYKNGISSINNSIGNYYLKLKQNSLAIDYFNIALNTAKEINSSLEILKNYLSLSNSYKNKKNYQKSLQFYHQYSILKDSLKNIDKERQFSKLEKSYELEISESQNILKDNEIELLERNKKINQLQMTILISGLLLVLIFGMFAFSRQKNKIKKDRELLEKNKQIHEAHKTLMSTTINNKNKELINFALHIGHMNEFIQALKSDIYNIKNKKEEDKPSLIKDLIFKINQSLRVNHELEKFQKDVDKVNRDFFNKLYKKYPDLTKNEKQLSALLRLNLSSKEIASLNNISTKAVEMSRYRLRKKLKLDLNTSLTDFLENL